MDYLEWLSQNDKGLSNTEGLSFCISHEIEELDFDVYLPSKGYNLQRGLVWDLKRKQELIMSILLRRPIPLVYFARTYTEDWKDSKLLVIDGKQRLTTVLDFIKDKFQIEILDGHYFYSQLPDKFAKEIKRYHFSAKVLKTETGKFDDDLLLEWFRIINFGGVSQMGS